MKLKIYRIYCTPSDTEGCDAIAFTEQQAIKYCENANNNNNRREWFYTEEEEIDTNNVLDCDVNYQIY